MKRKKEIKEGKRTKEERSEEEWKERKVAKQCQIQREKFHCLLLVLKHTGLLLRIL